MAVLPGIAAALMSAGAKSYLEGEKVETRSVSSSAIAEIGYIHDEEKIIVHFKQRGTYLYPGDYDLFERFASAPSVGQFFNEHIKPRY